MLSGLNIEECGCRHYDVPSLKRKGKSESFSQMVARSMT